LSEQNFQIAVVYRLGSQTKCLFAGFAHGKKPIERFDHLFVCCRYHGRLSSRAGTMD
jgi:hypothetical protein